MYYLILYRKKEKKEGTNVPLWDLQTSTVASKQQILPISSPAPVPLAFDPSQVLACVCVLAEHRPWNPTVQDDGIRSWSWNPLEWTGAFRRGNLRGLPSFPKTQCKGALEQARKWFFTITSLLGQAYPSSLQEPCKRKVCCLNCQESVTVAWAD